MSVSEYDISLGDVRLSRHFCASDFACRDKSSRVLTDLRLIRLLESLWDFMKCSSVCVLTGYVTPSYGKRLGMSENSPHLEGMAADILCRGADGGIIPAKYVLCSLEGLGHSGGAAYISPESVHVDVDGLKLWFGESGGGKPLRSFRRYYKMPLVMPYEEPSSRVCPGSCGEGVLWLQTALNQCGFSVIPDGRFGEKTLAALTGFQERAGLVPDGIAGVRTRAALCADGISRF